MTIMTILTAQSWGQTVQSTEIKSISANRRTEGQLPTTPATFVRFTGSDGLELDLTMPRQREFDYTVMFWFRSHSSLEQLRSDDSLLNTRAYIFELPGSAQCWVTRSSTEDPWIECTPGDSYKIKLADLPDIQSWMHLTYSANYADSSAYVSINGLTYTGEYSPMQDRRAYLASGFDYNDGTGHQQGFAGDYRQFWFAMTYIDATKIELLKHQDKALDFLVRAFYKFDNPEDRYMDAFRLQRASPVGDQEPEFIDDTSEPSPFCSSLTEELVLVPRFEKGSQGLLSNLALPNFELENFEFGYTVSVWIRNTGKQTYSANIKDGRNNHHFFELPDSFAFWWDSPDSFRVYVYATEDPYEVASDRIDVPLHEWINVQVSIDYAKGITAMTFNENGERLQYLFNEVFLYSQYPDKEFSLFESFSGTPYRLQLWHQAHKLPLNSLDDKPKLLVNLNFVKDDDKSEKWVPYNGQYLLYKGIPVFTVGYDIVPSSVNFIQPSKLGSLDPENTLWNGISCPNPIRNQVMFNGIDAGHTADVRVGKTDSYSVELWFKPNLMMRNELQAQEFTFLYRMQNKNETAMAIYIHDGELKCSPYGPPPSKFKVPISLNVSFIRSPQPGVVLKFRFNNFILFWQDVRLLQGEKKPPQAGIDSDNDTHLVFKGINPLKLGKWQHISCVFQHQTTIKGQYFATNFSPDELIADFDKLSLSPQTFMKDIFKVKATLSNLDSRTNYKVIIGAKAGEKKQFSGSFKDIRFWNTVRSDADIYSNRFVQVDSSPNLKANFKFIDGSPFVYNQATQTRNEAVLPRSMELVQSDNQNVVCPTVSYFNIDKQSCSSYPYSEPVQMIYTTVKRADGGYSMQLSSLAYSSIMLPGQEPKTNIRWSSSNELLSSQSLTGVNSQTFEFDTQILANGEPYQFEFTKTGADLHNFFVKKTQEVTPLRCVRVVDTESDEPVTLKGRTLPMLRSEQDLCFEFAAKRIDDCEDDIGDIQPEVQITTQPKLDDFIMRQFFTDYDPQDKSWKICLPKSTAANDLPQDRAMNFIFTVFFDLGLDNKQNNAYMSTVYTVSIANKINVQLSFFRETLNAGDPLEAELWIDARNTTFVDKTRTELLNYKWQCSGNLQAYCDKWHGTPYLFISKRASEVYVSLNEYYSIALLVSSLQAGAEPDAESSLVFKQEAKFIWVNQSPPLFSLQLANSPPPDGLGLIAQIDLRVSQLEQIMIVPENFRVSDLDYSYTFAMTPSDRFNLGKVTQSTGGTVLNIQPNALQHGMFYDLTATVTNKGDGGDQSTQVVQAFKTQPKITVESFEVSPETGSMLETEFTITITHQGIDNSLEYLLFGEIKVKGKTERVRIMGAFEKLDNPTTTVTMVLPAMQALVVRVRNSNREYVDEKILLEVGGPTDPNVIKLLEDLQDKYKDDLKSLWRYYQQVVFFTNSYAQNGDFTTETAIEVNQFVSNEALKQVDQLPGDIEGIQVIRYIFISLTNMNQYPEYMTQKSLSQSVQTIESLIIDGKALTDLTWIVDDDYVSDFINMLGNIFASLKKQMDDSTETSQRRLQDDSSTESFMFTLNNILNTFGDLLCEQLPVDNDKVLKYLSGDKLEINMQKISRDFQTKEIQFVSSDTRVELDFPIDKLQSDQEVNSPAYQWVCLQVSFFKQSIVPVADGFYPVADSYTSRVRTLDDTGYRQIDSDSGLEGFGSRTWKLSNRIDPEEKEFIEENQAKCLYIGGGFTPIYQAQEESSECIQPVYTEFKSKFTGQTMSQMKCTCDSLRDYQYGLAFETKVTKPLVCPGDPACPVEPVGPVVRSNFPSDREKSHELLLFILVPLLLCGCMPLYLQKLDRQDYQKVDSNEYKVDGEVKENFEKFERLRGKQGCTEEIRFNEQQLVTVMEMQEAIGFKYYLVTFNKSLHPFFSVLSRFDYRLSRTFRFSLVLGPISLITILIWIAFAKTGNTVIGDQDWVMEDKDWTRMVFIALVLSFLTLPLPRRCFKRLETEVYVFKSDKDQNTTKGKKPLKDKVFDDLNEIELKDIKLEVDQDGDVTAEEYADQTKATLIEKCMNCKRAFICLVYIFWFIALVLCASFLPWLREVEESNGYQTYLELTETDARYMIVTWYLTIFGFGWIGLNELRLLVVTVIATKKATALQAAKQPATETCATKVLIPLEAIEIALDIKYMRQIAEELEKDSDDEKEGEKDGKDGKGGKEGKGTEGAKVVEDEGKKQNKREGGVREQAEKRTDLEGNRSRHTGRQASVTSSRPSLSKKKDRSSLYRA